MPQTKRPDIPKKFAARIRGAQEKLRCAREAEVWYERDTPELEAKLEAFDADPDGWAEKNYPGHAADSYPVTTHISRARASLERRRARAPAHARELNELEDNLVKIEQEVLDAVLSMRPTTGRVPWPKPLPDMSDMRRKRDRYLANVAIEAKRHQEKRDAASRADEARQAARKQAEEAAAIRRMVAKGPEHVFRHSMQVDAFALAFAERHQDPKDAPHPTHDWTADLRRILETDNLDDILRNARALADQTLAAAKARGGNLWELCRQYSYHTPDSVAALDRGEKVPLRLPGRPRPRPGR